MQHGDFIHITKNYLDSVTVETYLSCTVNMLCKTNSSEFGNGFRSVKFEIEAQPRYK